MFISSLEVVMRAWETGIGGSFQISTTTQLYINLLDQTLDENR